LIGLRQIAPSLSYDALKNTIRTAFEETFQIQLISSVPSQEELSLAHTLDAQKYLDDAWTFRK
jgi:lipoate-protein ligase A